MPSHNVLPPGSVIDGRYRVLSMLGEGGMATVYRCTDERETGKEIALKVLHQFAAENEVNLERFKNELTVTQRLNHPNIVQVFATGCTVDGKNYFTMEYISGVNLSAQLHQSTDKIAFEEILRILYEIASALDYAHRQKIVHRDLKPDNILLYGDVVKVTDFGLARSLELNKSLTMTGETVGTPFYMAPEQFRGEKADARSDIYSFGIVAYELATRERPFKGENYHTVATAHLIRQLPPWPNDGLPSWFHDVVEICMQKERHDRYQSMREVLAELRGRRKKLLRNKLAVDARQVKPHNSVA